MSMPLGVSIDVYQWSSVFLVDGSIVLVPNAA